MLCQEATRCARTNCLNTNGAALQEYYQSDAETGPDEGNGKTTLSIEWTNQHGCGGNEHGDPHKLNCQIVLQYMCHPDAESGTGDFDPSAGTYARCALMQKSLRFTAKCSAKSVKLIVAQP